MRSGELARRQTQLLQLQPLNRMPSRWGAATEHRVGGMQMALRQKPLILAPLPPLPLLVVGSKQWAMDTLTARWRLQQLASEEEQLQVNTAQGPLQRRRDRATEEQPARLAGSLPLVYSPELRPLLCTHEALLGRAHLANLILAPQQLLKRGHYLLRGQCKQARWQAS
jgi:hypothetical protein